MSSDGEKERSATEQQKHEIWRKRARSLMIGQCATDQTIGIYGLAITYADGNRDYVDVLEPIESDGEQELVYIDTIQVAQYTTATQFIQQIQSYFSSEDEIPEEPEEKGGEKPSRTFH